jgi:hypothetical protein
MKYFVALALFLLSASVAAQIEHATTVAQCQADQHLWMQQLQDLSHPLPGFHTMTERYKEMEHCTQVDHANEVQYYNTSSEIQANQLTRLFNFVQRHDLWDKFIEEDAAGKR